MKCKGNKSAPQGTTHSIYGQVADGANFSRWLLSFFCVTRSHRRKVFRATGVLTQSDDIRCQESAGTELIAANGCGQRKSLMKKRAIRHCRPAGSLFSGNHLPRPFFFFFYSALRQSDLSERECRLVADVEWADERMSFSFLAFTLAVS